MKKLNEMFSIQACLLVCMALLNTAHAEKKLISAGGSVTEIIYALGVEKGLIAVDSSSLYPPQVHQLDKIGYFRSLSAEGLLSLGPNVIVAAEGAGPTEVLQQVAQAGVEVKVFERTSYTLESWEKLVREIADFFKVSDKAEVLIAQVNNNFSRLQSEHKTDSVKALLLMSVGQRGPVVAGKNTMPDLLFTLANFTNVAADIDGFKDMSPEALVLAVPDVIVVPSHVARNMGGKEKICASKLIQMTMPENNCRVLIMDGLLALGMGARIDQAVEFLLMNVHGS